MLGAVNEVKREVPLGKSRIDFLINRRDYLEVKTQLMLIPTEGHRNHRDNNAPITADRIIKHFRDISASIKGDSRALFLLCNMYDAEPFKVPTKLRASNRTIVKAAKKARMKGLETWQINLKLDRAGLSLIDCFRLNLF
jgi:sugar fermentation stimulation protein A